MMKLGPLGVVHRGSVKPLLNGPPIHHKEKDGSCTFDPNTLRTKLSPQRILKDVV